MNQNHLFIVNVIFENIFSHHILPALLFMTLLLIFPLSLILLIRLVEVAAHQMVVAMVTNFFSYDDPSYSQSFPSSDFGHTLFPTGSKFPRKKRSSPKSLLFPAFRYERRLSWDGYGG